MALDEESGAAGKMDTKAKRRGLAVVMVIGACWALVRRPISILILALVLYFNCERLLGTTPLAPYELTEILRTAKEAAIAAAGLVVAIASVTAFKQVKRLDLELAAAADISAIIRECSALLIRNRMYCEALLKIRWQRLAAIDGDSTTPEQRASLQFDIRDTWYYLTVDSPRRRDDQKALWTLVSRIIELEDQHGAILRSKVLTPWLLERAKYHLESIADAALYPIPSHDQSVEVFWPGFFLVGARSSQDYLDADSSHHLKALGYLGGASAIGSTSVAPVSLLNALRKAWLLWKL